MVSAPRHLAHVDHLSPVPAEFFQKPARLGQWQQAVTAVGGCEILRGSHWTAGFQRLIFKSLETSQALNPAALHL